MFLKKKNCSNQKRLEIEQKRLKFWNHMYCRCSQQKSFQHFENSKNFKNLETNFFQNTKLNYYGNELFFVHRHKNRLINAKYTWRSLVFIQFLQKHACLLNRESNNMYIKYIYIYNIYIYIYKYIYITYI